MINNPNLPDHLKYLAHLPSDVLKAIDGAGQIAQTLERQDLEGDMERLNILETPFYERLDKVQATAYEHEYNVITNRHDKIGYANYKDGMIPRTVELGVTRRRILPSLLGQRITITELAQATTKNGVKTAEQTARDEKIVAVMEETEYQLFYGDRRFGSSDFNSNANLQFDGIERIVKGGAGQNVLDLKGKPLSLAALWAAENKVYQTQGLARPSTVFMSPVDKINLQAQFYQMARLNGAERAQGLLGATAQSYISAYGETELATSRFLGDFHKFSDQAFGSSGHEFAKPSQPIANNVVIEADPVGTEGLDVGTYEWAIKAANFNGESEPAYFSGTVADAGKRASFRFTYLDPQTKWLILYRRDNGTGKFKYVKKIPVYTVVNTPAHDSGHETVSGAYGDFTYKVVPGTGYVAGIDFMTTNLAQWIPLEQVPLPQTLNRDFAIRHVSSLFSRAPEFNFLIVNVGQDSVL